jgi:hypothetical protein
VRNSTGNSEEYDVYAPNEAISKSEDFISEDDEEVMFNFYSC